MPLINLIKEQRLIARQGEQRTRTLFLTFVGAISASVTVFLALFASTQSLHSEAADLRKKLKRLEPLIRHIESNEKQLIAMGPKLATLEDAQKETSRWLKIINHLARSTPNGVWMTQMKSNRTNQNEPVALTLTGLSKSQDCVADLLTNLQLCRELTDVKLKYTQADNRADVQAFRFEITANVVGTEKAPPTKSKSKGSTT